MTPASLLATSALVLGVTYVVGALWRQRRTDRAWTLVARALGGRYQASLDDAPDRVALRIEGVDVDILSHVERDHRGRGVRPVTRVLARAPGIRDFHATLRVRAPERGGVTLERWSDEPLLRAWISPEARARLADSAGYVFRLEGGQVMAERGGLDDDPDRLVAVAGAVAALALGGRDLATRWRLVLDGIGAHVAGASVRDLGAAGLVVRLQQGPVPVTIQVAAPSPGEPRVTTVAVERLGGRGVRFALARRAQIPGFADVPGAPLEGVAGWYVRGKQPRDVAAVMGRRSRELLARSWPEGVLACVVGPRVWIEWPGVEPDAAALRGAIELVAGWASGGDEGPYR
jgi:hypothetical protein